MAITAIAFLPAGGSAAAQTRDTYATSSSLTVTDQAQSDQFAALIAASQASLTDAFNAAIAAEAAARSAAIATVTAEPSVRLTLVPGTPFMTTTQAAKTNIYMTPIAGVMRLPSYNGSAFVVVNVAAEQTFILDGNAAHPGYHQNGMNFDLWWDDAGQRLVTGPAWSSDTARAADIATLNGWVVNAAPMTAKFDTSASTAAIAANRALHLGGFRCSADGQTQHVYGGESAGGTAASFLLSNRFNRCQLPTVVADTTDSWAYTSTVIRPANNKTTMRASFFDCRSHNAVFAQYSGASNQDGGSPTIGVGLDSTTAFAAGLLSGHGVSGTGQGFGQGAYIGYPGMGYHYLQALEYGGALVSFVGDNGSVSQSGLAALIWM